MKRIIFNALFLVILTSNCFSQKQTKDTICLSDTLTIMPFRSMKLSKDSASSYKAIKCETTTNVGMRFEVGISKYYYNDKTQEWLGNHGGPNFNLILTLNKLNFGLRFKPWTVNPKTELSFDNIILPRYASLNPVKIDYYAGYSIDLNHKISIEPYLGFSKTIFYVINEVELQQTYSIPKANGLISGATFNKYFKINNSEYIALFTNIGYSFVDYKKTNQNLGIGYFEWTIGIAYKGFFKKQFLKKIE